MYMWFINEGFVFDFINTNTRASERIKIVKSKGCNEEVAKNAIFSNVILVIEQNKN